MEKAEKSRQMHRLSFGGLLIALGVVYGDIGTSPLYVMKAIIAGNGGLQSVSEEFILGAVSLVIWVLTLLTTIKYVVLALRADNHGEGGIFALYTLVRKIWKFLVIPAMIGGAALLADSMLTPAMTITSAVEGLQGIPDFVARFGYQQKIIIVITLSIMLVLFFIQRFGTAFIGKAFGPIMFSWFTFLGIMGLLQLLKGDTLFLLKAFNPYYAIHLLFSSENKAGIFILGSVFLATTGAEDLYADLGHVGKSNIRASWPYVKICLLLNYFGQAAWLIHAKNSGFKPNGVLNPFFAIIPSSLSIVGVVFATVAAIIASQALISGSYTLVSEAIKLKLLPRMKIHYPSKVKGQLYIPSVNFLLMLGSMGIVLYFRTSAHMESAYGLAITVTMMMTTTLLSIYFAYNSKNRFIPYLMVLFFAPIELCFFISNLAKFTHGGYVAVFLAFIIFLLMLIWERGNRIKEEVSQHVSLYDYMGQLNRLRKDETVPIYQTNVVFLASNLKGHKIGREILYSILDKRPKRAKVYWFVNVLVTDEPYTKEYYVDMMGTNYIVNLQLRLGFRVNQDVNIYLRQIVNDLMEEGKLPKQPQRYSIIPGRQTGDFCFVMIREELSRVTELNPIDKLVMQIRLAIKKKTVSPARWFGLEYSEVRTETVPLVLGKQRYATLKQIQVDEFTESDE